MKKALCNVSNNSGLVNTRIKDPLKTKSKEGSNMKRFILMAFLFLIAQQSIAHAQDLWGCYTLGARNDNVIANSVYISNPSWDNDPNAILLVTQNWNPIQFGRPGVYNNHPIGVWYDARKGQWAVFNQDMAHIPQSSAFNVAGAKGTIHFATVDNTVRNFTYLNLKGANGNPHAVLNVTPNWNPGCRSIIDSLNVGIYADGNPPNRGSGVYNNHSIGVWYDKRKSRWAIFNQDRKPMPIGAAFNVAVGVGEVHRATASNTANNYTYIDNVPGGPDNIRVTIFVTQNWNPDSSSPGVYNNHSIGVWWNSTVRRWAIFNQDRAKMPVGAAFNVAFVRWID